MKPLEYFLLFLILIIGVGFLVFVAILMHKNSSNNYDGNGDDTKLFPPENNNYYPYYVPPPKKGMAVKIHVIQFGILREYNSLRQVKAETGISIAKIKECIGTGKEYSNFIFKQLMY